MQVEIIVLITVSVLILLLMLPFVFSIRLYFNIKQNLGVIAISVFKIPILCVQVSIHELAIDIIRSKGKKKQIQIRLIDKYSIFLNHFLNTLFRYFKISEFSLFCDVGCINDAYKSSMLAGFFQNLIYSLYAMLYTVKKEFKAYSSTDLTTETNELKIALYLRFRVSLFIVLVSLIRAKFRTNRTVKVYERFFKRQK